MRRAWTAAVAVVLVVGAQAHAGTTGSDADDGRWITTATTGAPFGQFPNLSAFADGSAFALVDGVQVQPGQDGATGVGLIRSRDGGRTWEAPVTQPSFAGMPLLAMAGGRDGFFASGHLVSRTRDGAASWSRLTVPPVVPRGFEYATALDALPDGQAALLAKDGFEVRDGCPYTLRRTPLQITGDGGRSWTARSLPFTSYPIRAELATPQRAVVTTFPYEYQEPVRNGNSCSTGSGLLSEVRHLVTADGGRRWRAVHDCRVPCVAAWADPATLVVVGRDGTVQAAGNGGTAPLKPVGQLPGVSAEGGQYVHAVDFLDRRIGYAAVYGAGVFRTDDGGRTWVLERREVERAGIGIFADVAAIDPVRAVAASTSGIHARIADPLPLARRAPAAAGGPVAETRGLRLDGSLSLPVHRAAAER